MSTPNTKNEPKIRPLGNGAPPGNFVVPKNLQPGIEALAGFVRDRGKKNDETKKDTEKKLAVIKDKIRKEEEKIKEQEKLANSFGPGQKRPEGDNRSARDIIDQNPSLKNLSNEQKDDLKKYVGDYEKDPDAAYRADQVIKHIEEYDSDGNKIKNKDAIGDSKIDGYFKGKGGKNEANPNTEAGRLQDFGKEGYKSLKGGEEPYLPENKGPNGEDRQKETLRDDKFGPDQSRPKGDDRTVQEIIDDNPTLKNLSDQQKKELKEKVGDYEINPDAAYRAEQVIKQIEEFLAGGTPVKNKDGINDGRLDGFFKTKDGTYEANPYTEAARFQDFFKDGYSSFRGGPADAPATDIPKSFQIPSDDKRSAQEIIEQSPALNNLDEKQKQQLKDKFGDYEKDPGLAYALAKAMANIELFDSEGNAIKGTEKEINDPFNGKIDGFNKNGGPEDNSEADRFEKLLDRGFPALDGDLGKKEPNKDTGAGMEKFSRDIMNDGLDRIIEDANLPKDRNDMLEHPENYTTEQRAAAITELQKAMGNMVANPDLFEGPEQHGVKPKPDGPGSEDIQGAADRINKAIEVLSNDEVVEYLGNQGSDSSGMQKELQSDPTRLSEAQALYDAMTKDGKSLDDYIKKAGGNVIEGMKSYYQTLSVLNQALGEDGKPLNDNVMVDLRDNPKFDDVFKAFDEEYRDPDTLTKLITEKGMTEEQATQEMTDRAELFSTFGAPPDVIAAAMKENVTNYQLKDVAPDDMKGSGFVNPDGTVNEKFLNEAIDNVRKNDPDFFGSGDQKLTNGQIITAFRGAFDAFRNTAKLGQARDKMNLGNFLKKDGALNKMFGNGTMHAVSGLFAAGIGIARSQTGKELSPAEMAGVAGAGIQAFGLGGQAFEFTQRGDPNKFKKLWKEKFPDTIRYYESPADVANAKKTWTSIMNYSKILNGSGGLMLGATGVAQGFAELDKGNKELAGLYFAQGGANTISAMGPLLESGSSFISQLIRGKGLSPLTTGRLFTGIGGVAFVANVLAGVAVGVFLLVKDQKKDQSQREYNKEFVPILESYGLNNNENSPGSVNETDEERAEREKWDA